MTLCPCDIGHKSGRITSSPGALLHFDA
ncbi:MAG: hypothetical protein RIS62_335, partial [Chloroflexota bacterium]